MLAYALRILFKWLIPNPESPVGQTYHHYSTLGVSKGASEAEIKAAYRKLAKETHPDASGVNGFEAFLRVRQAYEFFEQRGFRSNDEDAPELGFRGLADAVIDPDQCNDEIQIVRDYLDRHQLEIDYNGNVVPLGGTRVANSSEQIGEVLAYVEHDCTSICNAIVLEQRRSGRKFGLTIVRMALETITREAQAGRQRAIMEPLFKPLSEVERFVADQAWLRLCRTCFNMDAKLAIAVLKKTIHQIKSKALNRPVKRHLMAVVQGIDHGSGKTTFVRNLLSPLQDLATGETTLEEFVDSRAGDLYRYLAVFMDDLDKIAPERIPTLNSLVTSQGLLRRRLGSSRVRKVEQRSTLIGTCQRSISELIPDETGNRRFAALPYRHGDVLKGGNPEVWRVVGGTDYTLLWRSVDVFGEDPIEAVLPELYAWQRQHQRKDPIEAWLSKLDLASVEVREIRTTRGIPGRALYDLYRRETGPWGETETAFGRRVTELVQAQRSPFVGKDRYHGGVIYTVPGETNRH